MANRHLCVTEAMKEYLGSERHFKRSKIRVLYDRPTDLFLKEIGEGEREEADERLWKGIKKDFKGFKSVKEAKGKDFWMVSSTSWTADEDLSILLKAGILWKIDRKIKGKIVLFITGKDEGSLKKVFLESLSNLRLENIVVIPTWLEIYENYVHLLRWCDVGLCFHNSSSGLDLPMKIVDMFGVGIPVICCDFEDSQMETKLKKTALRELVRNGENGFVFSLNKAEELEGYILKCFMERDDILGKFRQNIEEFRKKSWENEWKKIVKPLIIC